MAKASVILGIDRGIELDFIITDFEIDFGGAGGKVCLMGEDPKTGKLKTIATYNPGQPKN